jgi:hypothetical protein
VNGENVPSPEDVAEATQLNQDWDRHRHGLPPLWLWKKMATLGYCHRDRDPSLLFANSAPAPRQAVWREGEVVRLIKHSWRQGYHGSAACLALAWDSQLSPVDARTLTAAQLRRDPVGSWFEVDRAKTGRAAKGTLSTRADRILRAYMETKPVDVGPIFPNRAGTAYTKDQLGDDFRAMRTALFGTDEGRQLADFRRSDATEALAGDAAPETLSSKMANSLSASNRLHKTYGPVQLAYLRDTDAARARGRAKLREQKSGESVPRRPEKCPPERKGGAK